MGNTSLKKTPVSEQESNIRINNFDEVCLGYSEEEAYDEAGRCLNCKSMPCVEGCPVGVKIPEFIGLIRQKDYQGAYEKIRETNNLPAVCGRVCPQEAQCEAKCIRGIKGESVAVGRLERFCADWAMQNNKELSNNIKSNKGKVAVVGSGPAGVTCAGDLARLGYNVTVFEAFHAAGGVLIYGIPEFRLPKDIVQKEINNIKELGVKIECNTVIGKTLTIYDLMQDFDAVFIGSGAGLPNFMNIEGEDLNGVYSANEFLTRINLMKAYRFPESNTPVKVGETVCVIGGGNVAIDSARCAKRLGAKEVIILYRRSKEEMPARFEEIHHAEEEGIKFNFLISPTRITGAEGWVKGIECIKIKLGEPDISGRRRPEPIEGSEYIIDADTIIVAIGQSPNPLIKDTLKGLKINKHGGISADEYGRTNIPGIFAGGDIVTGAATVILAMGAGKKAAVAIDEYIKTRRGE